MLYGLVISERGQADCESSPRGGRKRRRDEEEGGHTYPWIVHSELTSLMGPLRTDSAAFVSESPAESLVHSGTKEKDFRRILTKLWCPVRVSPCVHSQENITATVTMSLSGEDMLAPVMAVVLIAALGKCSLCYWPDFRGMTGAA